MAYVKKPYLPDYFDTSRLSKEEKDLIEAEKSLQKALAKGNMTAYHALQDECNKGWRKLVNTQKMRDGRGVSERSYQMALTNLKKIGVVT